MIDPGNQTLVQIRPEAGNGSESYRDIVIRDFWICCVSREASLLARREVLTGKAKFGILGDGKEVPQVALARVFQKGDWRAGYYRDQTIMFALGLATVEAYFAQLYADVENDPWSKGRQMNCHFATPTINPDGTWKKHRKDYNISADVSSTGGQMGRAVGLALASKHYRNDPNLNGKSDFSDHGNEVCFCTIGDASTSEGVFWESVNAAAVLKIPLAISVWDDGYGISVPIELQTAKKSISRVLEGFHIDEYGDGILLYTGKAWDYPGLCAMYEHGIAQVRERHIPAVFHIQDCTQPQGHSTSGSHERYKSAERMRWEDSADCIRVMGEWMVENALATEDEITAIRDNAKQFAREGRKRAWTEYRHTIDAEFVGLKDVVQELVKGQPELADVDSVRALNTITEPLISEVVGAARRLRVKLLSEGIEVPVALQEQIERVKDRAEDAYHAHLYCATGRSATEVPVIPPVYDDDPEIVNGFQVLNAFFDKVLEDDPKLIAFGEDVGKIGDVNQGFAGLQEKHGEHRVYDTGIREWTIVGQAIGMAMRGLRPIAEIQYLDYLVYALPPLTDDLATLRYRSAGQQMAPAIIRTRGHRLEGIWHSGSQMGMIIHALRGMWVCVPRNMVQAAGLYRTLLLSDDPALVIECLNGYRLKEALPANIGQYTVPLGVPEILRSGEDITVVSYGSVLRQIAEAAEILSKTGVSVEIIDVQTLLPFDLEHVICHSLQKTNRVLFLDEDVPGGASAYMLREVLEVQGGYQYLDSPPQTLTAYAHRPPYGSDGDYFSKPSVEDIVEKILAMMAEADETGYGFAGSL